MKVLKFGGTSVGDAQAIGSLTHIVAQAAATQKIVVVCSAMGGVTNQLIALANDAAAGRDTHEAVWELREKHQLAMEAFFCDNNPLLNVLEPLFAELQLLLGGIRALQECSARTYDKVMALGEQLSCRLITAVLQHQGLKAVYADARHLVCTNSMFGQAQLNEAITNERIRAWYATLNDAVPVVTGFIASDAKGQTTTLGRGGSDYTAAIFGAALEAKEIQIWTDVDGFLTADPRMVQNAFSLSELSYREAMELSFFGAKVIYPPTLIPAMARNIPISIKNTFSPDHPGTTIQPETRAHGGMVRGISSIATVSLIHVEGGGMVGLRGFGGRLFTAMAQAGVNIILITQASSEHSISFAVKPEDEATALEAIHKAFELEILSGKLDAPVANTNLSIVAVVGENMRHTKGLSGKLFHALGHSGINVVAIAQGSSELNISVVISKSDLAKALNAVHDALFLSPVRSVHLFLAGTGVIGSELLGQLVRSEAALRENQQIALKLTGLTNSRKMLFATDGTLIGADWKAQLKEGETADLETFVEKIKQLNLPNSIFVDNTGSPAPVSFYNNLLSNHIAVVASNKIAASARMSDYLTLKETARKNGVGFYFETNVGAGLPIIQTMNDLLVSGDRFLKIEAILSGTISFIFNHYAGEKNFAEVVREAQQKGFTEPDPRDDLNGLDFARKMLILAREAGWSCEMEDVQVAQLLPESCLLAPDIPSFYEALRAEECYFSTMKEKAAQESKALRYIGAIENGRIKVSLELVDDKHPFFNMGGSDNIIAFTTLRYSPHPLVIKGPGAGAGVTAAGVFADVLRAAKSYTL